jgi:Ca2+-binding RTX toxin-like protein
VTETANITVTVNAVADIVADTVTTNEDTAISFNPITGTNGSEADNFEGSPQITQINGTTITAGGAAVGVTNGSVSLGTGNVLTFTPTADFNGVAPAFTYTVLSGGVTETANITVTVSAANHAPVAVHDNVITNVGFNSNINIPDWALLSDDVDADGDSLTITGAGDEQDSFDAVSHSGTTTTFVDGIFIFFGTSGGSFDYTVSDGMLSSTGHVTVSQDNIGSLDGTGGDDILIGKSGGTTINGNGGNDILIGGSGGDTLTGGAGSDTFVFGPPTPNTGDVVADFTNTGSVGNRDHINVSAFDANSATLGGDQAFAFVAAQNSGVVANSLTWFQTDNFGSTNDFTTIRGDTDGVLATVELQIKLLGLVNLTSNDFIL